MLVVTLEVQVSASRACVPARRARTVCRVAQLAPEEARSGEPPVAAATVAALAVVAMVVERMAAAAAEAVAAAAAAAEVAAAAETGLVVAVVTFGVDPVTVAAAGALAKAAPTAVATAVAMETAAALMMVALATVEGVMAMETATTATDETATATAVAWKAAKDWGASAVEARAVASMVLGEGAGVMEMVEKETVFDRRTSVSMTLVVEGTDQPQSTVQQTQSSCPYRRSIPRTG